MSPFEVVRVADADALATEAAARLVAAIVEAQDAGRVFAVGLTGGGVGIALLEKIRSGPAAQSVDWSRVEFWWGDERFLPAGDGERNDQQAREALLDHVGVDPARVHPMAASDGPLGPDPDAGAAAYAAELVAYARPDQPLFDVLLLGMGPEGHTASIFPDSPAAHDLRPVFAVRDCPKPPPTRISLGFDTLCAADQVWMIAGGAGKADAVAAALGGASRVDLPAGGARGRSRTLWLLDEAAATGVDDTTG